MNTNYKVTVAPATEPVTLAEVKAQVRVETAFTDDDTYLTTAISTARQIVEDMTGRKLIDQTIEMVLDCFPSGRRIELTGVPLSSVTSVEYYDEDNSGQTFSSGSYLVSTYSEPGFVELDADATWPATYDRFDAVKITYQAGVANAAAVKETLKHAILMMVADLYGHRDATTEGGMQSRLQRSAEALIGLNQTTHRW